MLASLKSWWEKKGEKGRKEMISTFISLAVMIVYVVVILLLANLLPSSPIVAVTELHRPMAGTWSDIWPRILGTLYYLCFIIGIGLIVRGVLWFVFIKADNKTQTVIRLISSTIKYVTALVFIFVTLSVWGVDGNAILVSAGVIALVVGLGAQSLISDIIAGLSIVFEGEYEVGDVVLIDSFRGTVLEIGLTTTKLIDSTNNVKVINNSKIQTVVNLSQNATVVPLNIAIDYSSDLLKVEEVLKNALPSFPEKIPQLLEAPKYSNISALADSSVNIRINVLCEENDRFVVERAMNREIFLLFNENGISFPFPQVTVSKRED